MYLLGGICQITQILLGSPDGVLNVQTDTGSAKMPVGEYRLHQASLTRTDDQGRRWELQWRDSGRERTIKVTPGRTTELPLGSPLQAHLTAYVNGRNVDFNLTWTDATGFQVSRLMVEGQRPPLPQLRIQRADGKEVALQVFQYG